MICYASTDEQWVTTANQGCLGIRHECVSLHPWLEAGVGGWELAGGQIYIYIYIQEGSYTLRQYRFKTFLMPGEMKLKSNITIQKKSKRKKLESFAI